MKNQKITLWAWKWCQWLAVTGFVLWLIETVYFLIKEGWHYAATSKAEILCDSIVDVIWRLAMILFFFVLTQIVFYLLTPPPINK